MKRNSTVATNRNEIFMDLAASAPERPAVAPISAARRIICEQTVKTRLYNIFR